MLHCLIYEINEHGFGAENLVFLCCNLYENCQVSISSNSFSVICLDLPLMPVLIDLNSRNLEIHLWNSVEIFFIRNEYENIYLAQLK